MHRERVSDNVYWFQSEIYAQVTAGAIVGPQWAVLIDTLMPQETKLIRNFLENDLRIPVRYIINTHHHADHSWGNCFFPDATVIAHATCRELMLDKSSTALAEAGHDNPLFKEICIVPPHLTFNEGAINIRVGKKQLHIFHTPGHSQDGVSVLLEEDRILFAGDAFMPVPFIVGGSLETLLQTTRGFAEMSLDNIVQGHGDVILRGEIDDAIKGNIAYLKSIQKIAKAAARRKYPLEFLQEQDIEFSGKNRVSMGGIARDLHQKNLRWLLQEQVELLKNKAA